MSSVKSRRFPTVVLVGLVAAMSYLAARLGGTVVIRPQQDWPFWPGNILLASVLLLVPRRIWPILIAAAFAMFVLFNVQTGLPIRAILILLLSDTVEVLTAALGLSYSFEGVPQLNSVKALAKYSFFAVFLAPFAGAFLGALASHGEYWASWRIAFFAEALGYLTLMPAILGWVTKGQAWLHEPFSRYLEAFTLLAGLIVLGYFSFVSPWTVLSPALTIVPFLLWSALRFGSTGVSSIMIAVGFLVIWGAVHGQGPAGSASIRNVQSLQLYLLFTAAPFMVLAAIAEEQKRTERSFRESEARFRLVADTAPALIWMADVDKLCSYFNKSWLDFTGRSIDSEIGNGWAEGVHPGDLPRCMDTYTQSFDRQEEFRMEYRLRRHDGEYRWIIDIGVPRYNQDHAFVGYIGIGIDVTERKRAEEILASVSRRLIDAQDQERARIARELHDDFGQRLAMLNNELDQLQQDPLELPSEVRGRLRELQKDASGIAVDVQSLSHELHSSRLELLGIAVAVRGFCREYGEKQNIHIDLQVRNVPSQVSAEISLCLFRVLQEALHNSVKHSGVRNFDVQLWGTTDELLLTVKDSGAGFDREAARASKGIGLISMEERLKLVKGTLSIDSQLKRGTIICARVPLGSGDGAMRPTG